jgi:N-acetylglucosaminyldiphosphoundecaprenol N-acetyl-beta-D-mannosaminyltransferase
MNNFILGTRVDPTNYEEVTSRVMDWSRAGESRTVCVANVHVIMEAYDSSQFQGMINGSDIVTPDGMPLVWILRRRGHPHQTRVYGPDLTLKLVEAAAEYGVPVGFYGSTPAVLEKLTARLKDLYPQLNIVYSTSPPFRPLSTTEDERVTNDINTSTARILFVGLGCPRQERWIMEHRGRVQSVMLAVGAAFDIHAGSKPQAPAWMQRSGLEWIFRLLTEPERLWKRYFFHNPRFLWLTGLERIGFRHQKTKTGKPEEP